MKSLNLRIQRLIERKPASRKPALSATLVSSALLLALGAGSAYSMTDTDGDGLSDEREVVYMTDINNPDTDGDGLLDGIEVDVLDTLPR